MSYLIWIVMLGIVCFVCDGIALCYERYGFGMIIAIVGLVAVYIGGICVYHFPNPEEDNRRTAPYHRLYHAGYEQALKDMEVPGWTEEPEVIDLKLVPVKDE